MHGTAVCRDPDPTCTCTTAVHILQHDFNMIRVTQYDEAHTLVYSRGQNHHFNEKTMIGLDNLRSRPLLPPGQHLYHAVSHWFACCCDHARNTHPSIMSFFGGDTHLRDFRVRFLRAILRRDVNMRPTSAGVGSNRPFPAASHSSRRCVRVFQEPVLAAPRSLSKLLFGNIIEVPPRSAQAGLRTHMHTCPFLPRENKSEGQQPSG